MHIYIYIYIYIYMYKMEVYVNWIIYISENFYLFHIKGLSFTKFACLSCFSSAVFRRCFWALEKKFKETGCGHVVLFIDPYRSIIYIYIYIYIKYLYLYLSIYMYIYIYIYIIYIYIYSYLYI